MRTSKIPKAKDFCLQYMSIEDEKEHKDAVECLREFAKLHVKQALKFAVNDHRNTVAVLDMHSIDAAINYLTAVKKRTEKNLN